MRTVTCAFAILLAVLFFSPAASFAQQDDATVLRNEIRAALLSDPRSEELSEGELSMLVESLAGEAERQGVAQDFLPEQTFDPADYQVSSGALGGLSMPAMYGIVLVSLALAMVLMKHLYDIHHQKSSVPADSGPAQPPAMA